MFNKNNIVVECGKTEPASRTSSCHARTENSADCIISFRRNITAITR